MKTVQQQMDQFVTTTEDRLYWAKTLTTLRESLLAVEDKKEKEFGAKTGVWIEKLVPYAPAGYVSGSVEPPVEGGTTEPAPNRPAPPPRPPGAPPRRPAAARATTTTTTGAEIHTVLLSCRGVNLSRVKAGAQDNAHTIIAEGFAEELRSRTNYFIPDGTKLTGEILGNDGTNLTFTFNVTVKLARPVKL